MTPPTTARSRIQAWLRAHTGDPDHSDQTAVSYEGAPLLASDLQSLVEAFDKPCGSCHPCTNYADETWRAAGRKPPHVYEWDEARAKLDADEKLTAHVREFINERDAIHRAMSACNNQSDYDRWAGHAEARRNFARESKDAGIDLEATS